MPSVVFVRFTDQITVSHAVPMVLLAFADSAEAIARLRIAESNSEIWLKVNRPEASELDRVRRLPGTVYRVDDDALIRYDRRVPERSIRSLDDIFWQALDEIAEITLPVPKIARPIDAGFRHPLQLVRGGLMTRPDGLLASLDALKTWCETAPQSRLQCLRWVTGCDDRRCLILGKPLPPIEGVYFITNQRVLVPGGWTWSPRVDSRTVCEIFDVPPHHWLLWETPQSHSLIPDQAFAVMNRASVRTT